MVSNVKDQLLAALLSGQDLEEAQLTSFLQRPETLPRKRKRGSTSTGSQELWNEGEVGVSLKKSCLYACLALTHAVYFLPSVRQPSLSAARGHLQFSF